MPGTEHSRSLLRAFTLLSGAALSIVGLFLFGSYVVGVIRIVIEQPADRSWLFWGLALAGIGVMFTVGGVALLVVWRSLGRKWNNDGDRSSDRHQHLQ